MLIAGCCCCCCKELGAFGFSNDRSLVYWASTLSWGGAPSCGVPLPLVMKLSPGAGAVNTVTGHISRTRYENARIGASSYHRPALFLKQVNGTFARNIAESGRECPVGPAKLP